MTDEALLALRAQVCAFRWEYITTPVEPKARTQYVSAEFVLFFCTGSTVLSLSTMIDASFRARLPLFLFGCFLITTGLLMMFGITSKTWRAGPLSSLRSVLAYHYVRLGTWNAHKARIARAWLEAAKVGIHTLGLRQTGEQIAAFEESMVGEKSEISQLLARTGDGIKNCNDLLAKFDQRSRVAGPLSDPMVTARSRVVQSLEALQQERERLEAMKSSLTLHVQELRAQLLSATDTLNDLALIDEANQQGIDCQATLADIEQFLANFQITTQAKINQLLAETQSTIEQRAIAVATQFETGSLVGNLAMMDKVLEHTVSS